MLAGGKVQYKEESIDKYKMYPKQVKEAIKSPNKIYHFVDNLTK